MYTDGWFESSVNSEGIETYLGRYARNIWFESSVNSEGIETLELTEKQDIVFESSVNSEGIETDRPARCKEKGLRAV